jgi:hypothetical protein
LKDIRKEVGKLIGRMKGERDTKLVSLFLVSRTLFFDKIYRLAFEDVEKCLGTF